MSCSEEYMIRSGFRSAAAPPSSTSSFLIPAGAFFRGELFLGEDRGVFPAAAISAARAARSRSRSRASRIRCAEALIRHASSCVPFPWC